VTFDSGSMGLAFNKNIVKEVLVGSQAARAGLLPGFQILTVNGQRMSTNQSAIDRAIQSTYSKSKPTTITFIANGVIQKQHIKKKPYCIPSDAFETICIHGGYDPDETTSCAIPIYRTSSYVFKNTEHAASLFALKELGNIYTRIGNPTQEVLEARVAMMEGGVGALALSSGTSAVFYSIINLAKEGDNIVSAAALYGGTFTMFNNILPQLGITVKFCNPENQDEMLSLIDENTRALFVETLTNPSLAITDIEACAQLAKSKGLPLIVDATFSTPYLCKPLKFGADIVVHSLTKWMGGHGTGIGGIIVDGGKFNWAGGNHPLYTEPDSSYKGIRWGLDLPDNLKPAAFIMRARTVPLRNLGACISPDNAWIFLKGLETLHVRMDKHCQNALALASYLQSHPSVQSTRYPGMKNNRYYNLSKKYLNGKGGGMIVFEVKGGRIAGEKFINSVRIIRHLANVGDAKTLAIHPASTTHSQMDEKAQKAAGLTPGMIRLSVGIEDIEDLKKDLEQALRLATSKKTPRPRLLGLLGLLGLSGLLGLLGLLKIRQDL